MNNDDYRSARAEAKAAKARVKASRPWYRKKRWYALSLLALIVIIIIAANAGSGSPRPTSASSPASSQSVAATPSSDVAGQIADTAAVVEPSSVPATTKAPAAPPSAPATTKAPAAPPSAPATTKAPAAPPMTTAQQQAVDAAQSYLSLGQGFSEQGLLQQLTSSAGNGFSKSDAEFAINYLNPNWNQQAVDAAKGYLSLGQGFSEQGLLQQLTSSAGNGFTQAQAEFAINYLHPDWDQQAVEAAKGYLQLGGFSRASLIQQLTSSAGSGFTEAQAEYAANQVGL
jgi:hypothetical protein